MANPVAEYKFKDGSALEIHQDEDPQSPREWDNLGTMAFFHRRYNIGDKDHGIDDTKFHNWNEIEKHIITELNAAVIFPVRMYDHSGICFAMGIDALRYPFNCQWDSGQVGFIFVTESQLKLEYGHLNLFEAVERITARLEGELETYNQYQAGDIYGFIHRDKPCGECGGPGDDLDSCWGFYGSNPLENGMSDNLDEDKRIELQTLV